MYAIFAQDGCFFGYSYSLVNATNRARQASGYVVIKGSSERLVDFGR